MEMRNHICWTPRAVHEVIKIDAEAVKDTVFRAVHSPQPMLMAAISTDTLMVGTDQEFLKAFTNPDVPEVFSLLLGDSGMGKTHFIHWLRLNVVAAENTRVVNIPKVGTSLRNIVEKIIDQLSAEMRPQYLNKLTTMGGETHTQEQLQEKLLDSLAQAVSIEADRDPAQDMERREILKGLASLFRDPHIRSQWFLASDRGSIIKELTRHVYEASEEYNRRERDRRFEAEDFQIQGVRQNDVSLEARNMLLFFRGNHQYLEMAADLANQCLDAAIGGALSFSGEDLVALVGEVRKHLHRQGLNLILYIEDLSRMQGVDKALLDALTTPSDQGDQKLCPIRWIAAMTTGYFDRLEATITTRINLMGKIEAVPKHWEGQQAQGKLAAFMSRYLNAVRLGMSGLEEWEHATNVVPNVCDTCEHRDGCHDAFGTGDGFGLYPFTAEGLLNMAERSAPQNEFWFKPRRLLKNIVTPMLAVYGQDIMEGRFPPLAMVEGMGGEQLDALEKVEIQRLAGSDADRHLALQELWQALPKIVPFPESILQAFNLHPLQGKTYPSAPTVTPSLPHEGTAAKSDRGRGAPISLEAAMPSSPPSPVKITDPIIIALRDWGNGKPMADTVASIVRPIVFEAVTSHIEWDQCGISRTTYVGQSRLFRPTSVVFKGQTTKSSAHLRLHLPLNDAPRAATALQGLYLFNKHGHWDFEDGYRYLVYSQSCLEEWAEAALNLVRNVAPSDEKWNALDAATELLAVGAALSGNISVDSARTDIWSGIWSSAPVTVSDRLLGNELERVADAIARKWDSLQEHVKARSFGTKGGRTGNFLNPEEREHVLKRLMRNNWKLLMTPTLDAEMHSDFKVIADLYQKISQALPPALEAEAGAYRSWLEAMDQNFGPDMTRPTSIIAVFGEVQQAMNDGGFSQPKGEWFQQSLEAFAGATYNDARKRASMVTGTEPEKLAPYLFAKKNIASAMRRATSLAETAERFLADVSNFYDNRMNELEGGAGDGLQACWGEVGDTLDTLEATLGQLAHGEDVGRQES